MFQLLFFSNFGSSLPPAEDDSFCVAASVTFFFRLPGLPFLYPPPLFSSVLSFVSCVLARSSGILPNNILIARNRVSFPRSPGLPGSSGPPDFHRKTIVALTKFSLLRVFRKSSGVEEDLIGLYQL